MAMSDINLFMLLLAISLPTLKERIHTQQISMISEISNDDDDSCADNSCMGTPV